MREEEFLKIKTGDKVKVVDRWTHLTNENPDGEMDYLLGTIVEVKGMAYSKIKIDGKVDGWYPSWYLNKHCVEKRINKVPILTF